MKQELTLRSLRPGERGRVRAMCVTGPMRRRLRQAESHDGDGLRLQNGWSSVTAACVLVFTVLHRPCSTTLLTIKKETGSLRWTALAAALPTVFGLVICALLAHVAQLSS